MDAPDLQPALDEKPKGFPFPLPTLLVRVNLHETDWSDVLEGSLIETAEAFDTDAIIGRRFETVIVAWQHFDRHDDSALKEDTRRQLVDWINLHVMPRCRQSRRPIWL